MRVVELWEVGTADESTSGRHMRTSISCLRLSMPLCRRLMAAVGGRGGGGICLLWRAGGFGSWLIGCGGCGGWWLGCGTEALAGIATGLGWLAGTEEGFLAVRGSCGLIGCEPCSLAGMGCGAVAVLVAVGRGVALEDASAEGTCASLVVCVAIDGEDDGAAG
jgi:hypothetical protein